MAGISSLGKEFAALPGYRTVLLRAGITNCKTGLAEEPLGGDL